MYQIIFVVKTYILNAQIEIGTTGTVAISGMNSTVGLVCGL